MENHFLSTHHPSLMVIFKIFFLCWTHLHEGMGFLVLFTLEGLLFCFLCIYIGSCLRPFFFFFWVSCLQNLRCGLICSSGVVQRMRLGLEKCLGRGLLY